jgi:hypothetical protein
MIERLLLIKIHTVLFVPMLYPMEPAA